MLRSRDLARRALSTGPDGFIHKSIIPSYFFQDGLFPLPIPKLEDTVRRYLRSLQPLVTPAAFSRTAQLAAAFGGAPGAALQARLLASAAAKPHTSYISEAWFDAYLTNRSPLPLNLNPQLTWRDDPRPAMQAQAARAANIAHAAARFHLTLAAGALEPEVYHLKPHLSRNPAFQHAVKLLAPRRLACYPMYAAEAYPLDMSQYGRLFASTRLPRRGRDELVTAAKPPTHIVVARGGALFRVEVLSPRGDRALPVERLEAALAHILRDGSAGAEPPVAALTGAGRDAWADARAALLAAPGEGGALNAGSLAAVDDALFVLTLDGGAPDTPEALSRTMLHGRGTDRWFDKCLNIVVAANGRAGVSWEHAWGDGVAVLNFFNAVFDTVGASPARAAAAAPSPEGVARLRWALDGAALAALRAAEAGTAAAIAATSLKVYQTDSLNKADIKRSGLSPDGVMQAALQLAHWRAHGGPLLPSTYESASTAGFRHGRTETIRSATPEAAALCAAFDGGGGAGAPPEARFAALRAATEAHRALTLDGVKGQGCDRHLFALGLLAAGEGAAAAAPEAAAFFADAAYAHFKDIRLSTSTMSSPALDGGGFGPVSPHSYAVGYGTEERGCHFHIMAPVGAGAAANGPHAAAVAAPFRGALDNAALAEGVEHALRDIRACIVAVKGDTVKGGSGGFKKA